jgi:hypothetical protein
MPPYNDSVFESPFQIRIPTASFRLRLVGKPLHLGLSLNYANLSNPFKQWTDRVAFRLS